MTPEKRKDNRTLSCAIRISDETLLVAEFIGYNGELNVIWEWIMEIPELSEEQIKEKVLSQGLNVVSVRKFEMVHPKDDNSSKNILKKQLLGE